MLHESRILHSIPLTDRPFVFVLFVLNIKSKNLSLDSIRFVLASFALTKEKTVLAHFSDEFYILFFFSNSAQGGFPNKCPYILTVYLCLFVCGCNFAHKYVRVWVLGFCCYIKNKLKHSSEISVPHDRAFFLSFTLTHAHVLSRTCC